MELRHLRYFVAVAEERHFGRAAARLHMAQPPLSQQIRQLEAELGVDLLRRTTRRVDLTAAGAAYLVRAREILAAVDAAAEEARRVAEGLVGRLVDRLRRLRDVQPAARPSPGPCARSCRASTSRSAARCSCPTRSAPCSPAGSTWPCSGRRSTTPRCGSRRCAGSR